MARTKTEQAGAQRILGLTLAASVVLPIILLGYSGWRACLDLREQTELRIDTTLGLLTQNALKAFQSAELALYSMQLLSANQTDAEILAREPQLHATFADVARTVAGVQSLWLIGRDGRPLVSDLVSPMPLLDISGRDFYRALAAEDVGTYISAVHTPKLSGPLFFSVARRRPAAGGRFDGVINVSLRPADFEAFYKQLDLGRGDLYEMVRADGAILARYPEPSVPTASLNPPTSPLMAHIAAQPAGGLFTAPSSIDGVERLVGFRPVPGYRLFVVAGVPVAALRSAVVATLAGHLVFGLPATLLLVVTLVIAKRRTRRLFAEIERRVAAEAALSRTQRMEAIGQLTGGVAHDFNNLLMIIRGSNERLRRRVTDPRDTRSLDVIEATVQRGAALTRQLLTFASRQAMAVEVVNLSQHLPRTQEMVRRLLRGDIQTSLNVVDGACAVKIDPGEFDLALLNIVVNARDAMPGGGRLALELRMVVLDGGAAVDLLTGPFVAVSVADTGTGIAPEVLPRVFEPFFTTKATGQGTGLGLSQAFGFARQSGGTLTIESTTGRGTIATIYLPLTTDPLAAPPARADDANERAGRGRLILVVDDNADLAEVLRGLLQDLGHQVEVVSSARMALDRLQSGRPVDLLLSDIIMPGEMNGFDLAQEVRRRFPELPVLLTSGYSAVSEQAIRGGFPLLRKPYETRSLHQMVEAAIADPPRAERPGPELSVGMS